MKDASKDLLSVYTYHPERCTMQFCVRLHSEGAIALKAPMLKHWFQRWADRTGQAAVFPLAWPVVSQIEPTRMNYIGWQSPAERRWLTVTMKGFRDVETRHRDALLAVTTDGCIQIPEFQLVAEFHR